MSRGWAHTLWREQPGLHRGYVVDVLTSTALGLTLILGGRHRAVAPVWGTLNESGGPVLWGVVIVSTAVLLVLATFLSPRSMVIALWISAIPLALIGWWFLASALSEPTASFVGAVYSFSTAFMRLSRAEAYRVGRGAMQ